MPTGSNATAMHQYPASFCPSCRYTSEKCCIILTCWHYYISLHAASNLSPYHGHRVWLIEGDEASHIETTGQGGEMLGVDGSEWR